MTLPDIDLNQMIHRGEKIGVIHRCNTANGEFIETFKKNAALMNYFKKIIYLSSFQVYGNYQENKFINEKSALDAKPTA